MNNGIKRHLTFANIASALALFVALATGGAYAANTVFSGDIVDGQVKAPDIAQGAVLTDEIANGQVKAADIGDGEVKIADVGQNAVATDEISTGAVRTAEIANGQVGADDLAAGVKPGASGARAYATVAANGDFSRDKGVLDVTLTGPTGNAYCIDLVSSINPATATLVAGPDEFGSQFSADLADVSVVLVDSLSDDCFTGELEVNTYVYDGDRFDNDEGLGDEVGDILEPTPEPFTFVVP